MTRRHREQWEALGAADPYWAVLTDPTKKDGRWDKAEFFRTGEEEISDVLARVDRLGVALRPGVALDYGCGVGRLSRALSARFERVLGFDISESMLREARAANEAHPNIEFRRASGDSLEGVESGSVDLVYSNIVLQHIPPPEQRSLLREFCRVLRSGGLAVFQTPSHPNLASAKGYAYLLLGNGPLNLIRGLLHGRERVMELHTVRKSEVLSILTRGGMSLLEAERYDSAGKAFVSFRYWARKQ